MILILNKYIYIIIIIIFLSIVIDVELVDTTQVDYIDIFKYLLEMKFFLNWKSFWHPYRHFDMSLKKTDFKIKIKKKNKNCNFYDVLTY